MFGKVGLMAWEESAKTNNATNGILAGSDLLLGAGADYKVNENWGIRGEYEHVGGLTKSHYTWCNLFDLLAPDLLPIINTWVAQKLSRT